MPAPFGVAFVPPPPGGREPTQETAGTDCHDETVAVIEACSVLEQLPGAQFRLSGFGRDEWPVDVGYDMSAFLESLPELAEAVRNHAATSMDLYPQGIECSLDFRPLGDLVEIRCTSRTDWIPDPSREVVSQDCLLQMLRRLATSVSAELLRVDPGLASCAPFPDWLQGQI